MLVEELFVTLRHVVFVVWICIRLVLVCLDWICFELGFAF